MRSPDDLAEWGLRKAQFLDSAKKNLDEHRLFPAAEEIFRTVETTLEALLYRFGVRRIEYPGRRKKFTGRLALQFLIRDNLLRRGRITRREYDKYLALASELHLAGYQQSKVFDAAELQEDIKFAEDPLTKARSIARQRRAKVAKRR